MDAARTEDLSFAVSFGGSEEGTSPQGAACRPTSTVMEQSDSRYLERIGREFAVLAVAAVGAYLFFIHGSLYLQSGSAARPLTLEGFLLVTAIFYLFLRLIFVVASLCYPRPAIQFTVCPECGKALDETTPGIPARHGVTAFSRKPTEKEVLAAVMLRKALDDARRLAKKDLAGPPPSGRPPLPSEVENAPVPMDEFERILKQLDSPRTPGSPEDRRPKGPA